MTVVLLDLWGVLCNHDEMDKAYRLLMSKILQEAYGGDRRVWLRAHDEAYVWYVEQFAEAGRKRLPRRGFDDRLDAEHIRKVFSFAEVPFPKANPVEFSRNLERRILSEGAAAYPDVPNAVSRLREAGHRLYVATGGSAWNAEGALRGAGLEGRFDGVLTGYDLDAFKADPGYWERALARIDAAPADTVAVDDSLEYLKAATSVGIIGLLLDRLGAHPVDSLPPYVRAVLRHLAGLPHFVESARASC